jgi:subtilisin family serine protease
MVKSPANEVEAGRQLIFMTVTGVRLEVDDDGFIATPSADTETINAYIRDLGVRVRRLFGGEAGPPSLDGDLSEEQRRAADDLARYLTVDAPDERLDELASRLLALDSVESAYVQPAPRPPIHTIPSSPPPMPNPPAGTPDFTFSQGYLQAAPAGIDALFAWSVPGGQGDGVNVIDIEGAWQLTHEDLGQHLLGLAGGTVINTPTFRHHGTAVIGVTGGDANTFGVTGISPAADTRVISHGGLGVGPAVTMAANLLSPGDVLIIEAHAPGPRFGFTDQPGQLGYVAMQYWRDVFAAITYATVVRGVIVVEAAGNGAEDFDDPLYSSPPLGFPLFWSPFDRGAMDNAAILVGAGAPPPGTHGMNHGVDRSRLGFSNFGACVDAQGWGEEVTTPGYGDRQGGLTEDTFYTQRFNGTSSATPIVAGAIACLQGVLDAAGKPRLTPITTRNLLQSIGSDQQDDFALGHPSTQHIGRRPDLFLMIASL